MGTNWKGSVALGLSLLAIAAFLAGRHVEQQRVIPELTFQRPSASASAVEPRADEKYRELYLSEILALPFADFYEALRSAPAAAREKWTAELEQMPRNARRFAAADAYYKLLVQFDPLAAAKAVSEIQDKETQTTALLTVVAAAPPSALPEMAKLAFSVPREVWPDYISGFPRDLLSQWSEIDPTAVVLFLETLPEELRSSYRFDVVRNWAATDPKAALAACRT